MNNKKITSFDSLRFIACIFIIWHHIGINIYQFNNIDNPYFRTAGLAVEIFFVLSGFLLARSYYKTLQRNNSPIDNCEKYFYGRIKRLWPEYIFAMLLCALLTNAFSHHISMGTFMLNAIMMAGWGGIPNIINGIWYVVVLFWGGCLLYNLLIFYGDKAKTLIIPIISCLCIFYLVNHGQTISGHQRGIEFKLLSKGTIRGILGLSIGIYCYQICLYIKELKITINPKFLSMILLLCEVLSVTLLINAILIRHRQDISDFNIYFYISYIVGLLYFNKEKLLIFLSYKFWNHLSDLSYTVYLTHLIVLEIVRVHWKDLTTMHPVVMYSIITLICLLFAFICYHAQKWLFAKIKQILLISESQNQQGEN